jgi:hypothetical protein
MLGTAMSFDWGVFKPYGVFVLLLSSALYLACIVGASVLVRGVGKRVGSAGLAVFIGTLLVGPMGFMAWLSVATQISPLDYQAWAHLPAVTTVLGCLGLTFLLWFVARCGMPERSMSIEPPKQKRRLPRWLVLATLVAGYTVLVAVATPTGVTSGQYPEILLYTLSGVLWASLVLLGMWAGLGSGRFGRRLLTGVLLCVLIACADALGASRRGVSPPGGPLYLIVMTVAMFSLFALAFACVRRMSGWHIADSGLGAEALDRPRWRLQFSLRHLLLAMTLAVCLLAFYHSCYPAGTATRVAGELWRQFGRRTLLVIPTSFAIFLSSAVVPWITLAYRGRGKRAILATGVVWAVFNCGVISVMTYWGRLGPFYKNTEMVVSFHLGAGAAGFVAAFVLRSCGYRIARYEKAGATHPSTGEG